MKPEFSTEEAISRASVVIDCIPLAMDIKQNNSIMKIYG